MKKTLIILAALSVLILSACGNNPLMPPPPRVEVQELGYHRGDWSYTTSDNETLVIYGETDLQGDCSVRSWGPNETAHIRGLGFRVLLLHGIDRVEIARIIDEVQARAVREAGGPCERR